MKNIKKIIAATLAILLTVELMMPASVMADPIDSSVETTAEASEELLNELPDELPSNTPDEDFYPPLTGIHDEHFIPEMPENTDAFTEALSDISIQDMSDIPTSYTNTGFTVNGEPAGGTNPYISSVKNQGRWGTCWAFSAAATAEAANIRLNGSDDLDISESQIVAFFYNEDDDLYDETSRTEYDGIFPINSTKANLGGNSQFTAFALAGWRGASDESKGGSYVYPTDDFSDENLEGFTYDAENAFYNDVLHMQNAYFLPTQDSEGIKKAVMTFGAVSIMYNHSHDLYCSFNNGISEGMSYYNPYSWNDTYNYDGRAGGHVVTIVGWDDDFDKNYFSSKYPSKWNYHTPEKNGAWLIKNSWGTDYPGDGFFWMSYEDKSADVVVAFDYENADNYDHNYQYDGGAGTYWFGIPEYRNLKCAAIYTASGDQSLEAVGVGVADIDSTVKVDVYVNCDDKNPESGILISKAETEKPFSYSGFYTIPLDNPVRLTEGMTFSVVTTIDSGKDNVPGKIFGDQAYNDEWIDFKSSSRYDKTFVYDYDDENWIDVGQEFKKAHDLDITLRIKAYTSDVDDKLAGSFDITDDMVSNPDSVTYTGSPIEPDIRVIGANGPLTKDEDYTVDFYDNENTGLASFTVTGINDYSGSVNGTFNITPKKLKSDMVSVSGNEIPYPGNEVSSRCTLSFNGKRLKYGEDYTIENYNPDSILPVGKNTIYFKAVEGTNFEGSCSYYPLTIGKGDISKFTCETNDVNYTGSALKPSVTLKCDDIVIPADNYSVAYSNNTNTGTGKITLTGKNNLYGTLTKEFTINPAELTADNLTVDIASITYSPKGTSPKVSVKYGNKALKYGTDYDLILKQKDTAVTSSTINAGDLDIIIDLKGNYTEKDDQEIKYTKPVSPMALAANKIVTSIDIDNKKITATIDGKEGTEDTDFTVDSIAESATASKVNAEDMVAGTKYDVTISLLGNYKGTKITKNLVGRKSIDGAEVLTSGDEFVYTGKAIKPVIAVQLGETILKSSDYTVTLINNTNVGTATVKVTGKGAYTGSASADFTITPKVIADSEVKPIKSVVYQAKPLTAAVTINGLKAGKDFTLENATYTEAGTYGVTVKLSDNYRFASGIRTLSVPYTITKAVVTSVKASNGFYQGGEEVKPNVTVSAGKLVLPKEEYELAWENNTQVTGKTKASVTLTGVSDNYALPTKDSAKTASFTITKENISKAQVEGVSEKEYTGKAIEFNADYDNVSITTSTGTYDVIVDGIVQSDDFKVTYSNNVKIGTAKMTIAAKPDSWFTGSKQVSFAIGKANLADILLAPDKDSKDWPEMMYSGSEKSFSVGQLNRIPFINKQTGDRIPVNELSFSYDNNVNAGYGTLIIKATPSSKLYTGSIGVLFPIRAISIESMPVSYEKTVTVDAGWSEGTPVKSNVYSVGDPDDTLKKNIEYTVTYANNTKKGYAMIIISGVGNYTGQQTLYYKIQ